MYQIIKAFQVFTVWASFSSIAKTLKKFVTPKLCLQKRWSTAIRQRFTRKGRVIIFLLQNVFIFYLPQIIPSFEGKN